MSIELMAACVFVQVLVMKKKGKRTRLFVLP